MTTLGTYLFPRPVTGKGLLNEDQDYRYTSLVEAVNNYFKVATYSEAADRVFLEDVMARYNLLEAEVTGEEITAAKKEKNKVKLHAKIGNLMKKAAEQVKKFVKSKEGKAKIRNAVAIFFRLVILYIQLTLGITLVVTTAATLGFIGVLAGTVGMVVTTLITAGLISVLAYDVYKNIERIIERLKRFAAKDKTPEETKKAINKTIANLQATQNKIKLPK